MCKKLTSHSTAQFQCREGYSYSVELSAEKRTVITATAPGYTKSRDRTTGWLNYRTLNEMQDLFIPNFSISDFFLKSE
jgi:hypothetical protein